MTGASVPPPALIDVAESEVPQPLALRCRLTRDVPAGARVRLQPATRRTFTGGYMPETIQVAGEPRGASWPVEDRLTPESLVALVHPPRPMLVARCPGAAGGDEVVIGGTFHSEVPRLWSVWHTAYAGLTDEFVLECQETTEAGGGAWLPASERFGFRLVPGPVDHLQASIDARGRVAVGFFDCFLNPADPTPADLAGLTVSLPGGTQIRMEALAADLVPPGGLRLPLPTPPAPGGRVLVRAGGGREALSAPAAPATPERYALLFGDFHWHSEVSGDGTRPLEDAYRSARDGLLLDFVGASDHYGPLRQPFTLEWYADLADRFLAPGSFVTLLGVEIGGPYGHHNVYWIDRQQLTLFEAMWARRRPGALVRSPTAPDLASYYGIDPAYFDQAQPGKTLIVPHHPNAFAYNDFQPGVPGWSQYRWPLGQNDPRFVRLCEIVQLRGAFETEALDDAWHVVAGEGGGSLRTGLARGFRVGFTGGTDNHCGWPTRGPRCWAALTGVYAAALTRADVMEALYARRCYATTGARIAVDFRLGDRPMGSEVTLGFAAERRFALQVYGTAPLDRAEVVSQGAVVARLPVDGPDLVADWRDDRRSRPPHDCYYYLRVRQTDGHCAWTSPVWVDLA